MRFEHSGSDSLAQFSIWIFIIAAGGIVPLILFDIGGLYSLITLLIVAVTSILGLRSRILVTEKETVITRLWFFIPYKTYRASRIEDVWYGGDWGLEEGAVGIVVKMDGMEIHIGSRTSMKQLFESLYPISKQGAK